MGDLDEEDVLLIVGLGEDAGGRVDLARMLARPAASLSRLAAVEAVDRGWLYSDGRVTLKGSLAVQDWRGPVQERGDR